MAETNFGRTGPNGVPRADIRTAPMDPDAAQRTVADDATTYSPLRAPGGFEHGFSPPSPAPLSEPELRQRLAVALEAQQQADEIRDAAQASHDRAQRHFERCTTALRSYDGLEDEVAQTTIAQLVSDAVRIELPEAMQDRVAARDRARLDSAAAVRADEQLAADLVAARGRAAEAATQTDRLIASVLAFTAEAIAADHARLIEQAAQVRETLMAFDKFVTNKRVALSPKVRAVLGHNALDFVRQHDQRAWRAAADALRADPMAAVKVEGV